MTLTYGGAVGQCVMTEIEIEYCVPCGLLAPALKTERALLEEFGQNVDSVALRPGHGGVFKVRVGDEVVWDKDVHGGELDLNLITDAVRNQTQAEHPQ